MRQLFFWVFVLLSAAFTTGCAGQRFDVGQTETVLPLNRAYVDGAIVDYVTTDVSDAAMAKGAGANYAPRLKGALSITGQASVLERVYKFSGNEQISIFQSAPPPEGEVSASPAYSPLWRIVLVHWKAPVNGRVLKSEEELLAAEEAGDVTLQPTQVVANCPIVRSVDGRALPGVR